MSHRRVDGRGRYGKEYGNSLVRRRTDEEARRATSPSKGLKIPYSTLIRNPFLSILSILYTLILYFLIFSFNNL